MVRLAENRYGKSDVRLTKVVRAGATHTFTSFAVQIMLGGDFEPSTRTGDNSSCIPTDTMKNTVYALARKHAFDSPEAFAGSWPGISHVPQVSWAEVSIEQEPWARIPVDGAPHPHCLHRAADQVPGPAGAARTAGAARASAAASGDWRSSRPRAPGSRASSRTATRRSRRRTTGSLRRASTRHGSTPPRRSRLHRSVRNRPLALLETFARTTAQASSRPSSPWARRCSRGCPQIASVSLTMPNQHRLLVNLEPFGMDNPNEIFVATSEPYGVDQGNRREGVRTWEG